MKFGVPVTIVMVLVIGYGSAGHNREEPNRTSQPRKMAISRSQDLAVFALTALAWITRSEPFGGWKTWLDLPNANDASVAFWQ